MRIGLLITSVGDFGKKGFYNAQEIGLAKSLNKIFDEVIVYKSIPKFEQYSSEKVSGTESVILNFVPTKKIGTNGLIELNILDNTLDALVCFSDTQFAVPKVYNWCKKNGVTFIPYIGVTESHSNNRIVRGIINFLFKRNIRVFKNSTCLAKTPKVKANLNRLGVNNVLIAPVGLDLTLLNHDYQAAETSELKQKYGYKPNEKVLLFIGRLVEEKQPERMIDILSEILQKDDSYRLLMVGKGELKNKVLDKISSNNLLDKVKMIESLPNSDIWELYLFAEAFINLNEQEIFGMVILEAMYYGCKVVALHAPGPDFIIENNISGVLCSNNNEIISAIMSGSEFSNASHNRILEKFTWKNTATIIDKIVRG